MEYSKELVSKYLNNANYARNSIMDLYTNTLYEDGWDETVIDMFKDYLSTYEESILALDELIPQIQWQDQKNKINFMRQYNTVLKADEKAFKLVMIRHDAYLTYRKFRKTIISLLNDAIGFVKDKGSRNLMEIFDYFNDECSKIPLSTNSTSIKGEVSVFNRNVLKDWFFDNIKKICSEVNESPRTSENYSNEEIIAVFRGYYKARLAVFAIFNMLTSSDDVNGYERYHNILDKYVTGSIRNSKDLKMLYDATNVEEEFLPADDYQQIMDDKSWNAKGIYESWFTDAIDKYNENYHNREHSKSVIKAVKMLSSDANKCRVIHDGDFVYAGTKFYPGDIIEICPTRILDKSSLYSKDMREVAFEVIPNTQWVLPFGYCQYYMPEDIDNEANCDFLWDPIKRVIVIKAINKIPKYSKLVLKTNA